MKEINGFVIKVDTTDKEETFHVHHAISDRFIDSYPTLKDAGYMCNETNADDADYDARS